ncbi:hypothetical protein ABK040_014952 [Willaertia magna]
MGNTNNPEVSSHQQQQNGGDSIFTSLHSSKPKISPNQPVHESTFNKNNYFQTHDGSWIRHQWYTNGFKDLTDIKSIVIILPGFSEHCNCRTIQKFAGIANMNNIAVYSFDLRLFISPLDSDGNFNHNSDAQQQQNCTLDDVLLDIEFALENVFLSFPSIQFPSLKIYLLGYSIGANLTSLFLVKKSSKIPDKRFNGIIMISPFLFNFIENSSTYYWIKQLGYWYPNYIILNFGEQELRKISKDIEYFEMLKNDPIILYIKEKFDIYSKQKSEDDLFLLPSINAQFAGQLITEMESLDKVITKKISQISRLNCNVLLLYGKSDAFVNQKDMESFYDKLKNNYLKSNVNCNLVMYDNLYHYLLYEKDNYKVYEDLIQFLQQ